MYCFLYGPVIMVSETDYQPRGKRSESRLAKKNVIENDGSDRPGGFPQIPPDPRKWGIHFHAPYAYTGLGNVSIFFLLSNTASGL